MRYSKKYSLPTKIFNSLLVTYITFLSSTTALHAQSLPGNKTAEEKLSLELQKMIDAGHLRPGYFNANEFPGRAEFNTVSGGHYHYWSNPAETIYTLLLALPLITESQQAHLRDYIQNEWANYNPLDYSHSGWLNGEPREIFDISQEAFDIYDRFNFFADKSDRDAGFGANNFEAYNFNPFNVYAAYLYAKEFGNAQTILQSVKQKGIITALPSDSFLAINGSYPKSHVLNQYIAGYYGYLNLQDLTNEPRSAQVESWLQSALQKRVNMLNVPAHDYLGTEAGGFLYLVPELAQWLRENAPNEVNTFIADYEPLHAYWFVSRVDEVTKIYSEEHRNEGSNSPYYDYASLFNAKSMILGLSRQELEDYLDVPAVHRGDLYYIQNLINTINADPSSPAPPPTATNTPQPEPTPNPDVNRDGNLDILDYLALIADFGKSIVTNADIIKNNIVDIFDFNKLMQSMPIGSSAPPTPSTNTNLFSGTGVAYTNGLPSADSLQVMADDVVAQIQADLNGESPSLVMVYTNAGLSVAGGQNVAEYIRDLLNPSAKLSGMGSGSVKYTPLSEDFFVAPDTTSEVRSISAMALGGTNLNHIHMVTPSSPVDYATDANTIGIEMGAHILTNIPDYQTKSNLVVLSGPYHGWENAGIVISNLTQGLQSQGISTNALTFIGAGGEDNIGSSFNQTNRGNVITGTLISGTFDLSIRGVDGFPTCPHLESDSLLSTLKDDLGGANPDALFYIPGHPDQEIARCGYSNAQDAYSQMQATIPSVFGTSIPTIGLTGASEIGHYSGSLAPIGDSFHFFVAGLKGN